MNTLPLVSHVATTPVMCLRKSIQSTVFFLCAVSSVCLAQEPVGISPPVSSRVGPIQMPVIQPKAAESAIIGTWGNSKNDRETGATETTVIVFEPDGRYSTRLRNSLFPEWEKLPMAGGRYAVTDFNKAGFTLVLDRTSGDPEEDKATARSTLVISIVDENTLRAPDGAVLTRLK